MTPLPTRKLQAFLAGNGRLTRHRANKYGTLLGFYRYAISRGYATRSPLPDNEPKRCRSAPPHIYSHDELRRLFDAVDVSQGHAVQLDANTLRTLLLLLYGAGLLLREAMRFTLADIDLSGAVLTVRDTKFYKTSPRSSGATTRSSVSSICGTTKKPSLAGRQKLILSRRIGTEQGLAMSTVQEAFLRLRRTTGIHGANDARRPSELTFVQALLCGSQTD